MESDDKARANGDHLTEWHRYYSAKRISQQWFQVHLLKDLPGRRVLEVGPYLGLVTAMLDNAGYDVTTFDILPPAFERPARPHVVADLLTLDPSEIADFDTILCCETLEHLPWDDVDRVLVAFRASGAPHLVVSVPYQGFQIESFLYLNMYTFRQRFSLKKLRFLKSFTPDADPRGHKWEVGYRRHGLRAWESKIRDAGWKILRRDFTHPTRSVFHVLSSSG